jgi:hypothetical protein
MLFDHKSSRISQSAMETQILASNYLYWLTAQHPSPIGRSLITPADYLPPAMNVFQEHNDSF